MGAILLSHIVANDAICRNFVAQDAGVVVEHTNSIIGSSSWTEKRVLELGRSVEVSRIITAEDVLAGFALLHLVDHLNIFLYPEPCLIFRRLYVSPELRGQGFAHHLLQEALAAASTLAVPLAWQTNILNTTAVSWLDRQGIEPKGQVTRGDRTDHVYLIHSSTA